MDHGSSHIGYGSREGESFRRYYLRHVAISEGCGCAELSITRQVPANEPRLANAVGWIIVAIRRLVGALRRG